MTRKAFDRNSRLEGEMRAVLAELLRFEVKDPRLADVTVSVVRLSADRSHARVFFSVLGDREREREAGDGFRAAGPFMRQKLGQRMHLRVVPSLDFERDSSYEYGDRMERLFERLHSSGALPPDTEDDTSSGEGP